MALPVVLFGYFGHRLDRWLGTGSGWMIGGGVLGMVVAFYQLFKRVQQLQPPSIAEMSGEAEPAEPTSSAKDDPQP